MPYHERVRYADSAAWAVRLSSATVAPRSGGIPELPWDRSVVTALVADLGEDFVRETAALYLAELDDRVAAVRRAASARDIPGLVGAAHTLKSASALLGLCRLAAVCRSLEHAARAGCLPEDDAFRVVVEAQVGRAALLTGLRSPTMET